MYQIGTNPNAPLGGAYQPETQQASYGGQQCNRPWRGDGVTSGYPGGPGTTVTGCQGGIYDGGASSPSGGLSGVLSGFYNAIQNLFSQLSAAMNGQNTTGTGTTTPAGSETAFKSATASSLGDPHLSFSGTSAAGTAQNGKWDNMQSHADLIDSDSFNGGYQVSTTATTPQSNGVTYNQSATVSMSDGATSVSFANNGTLAVTQNGQAVSVAAGQSLSLGNGETVTSNQDGSATVSEGNGYGRTISTTMKSNGPGVDVTTTATHADLGGYLVTGQDSQGITGNPVALGGAGAAVGQVIGYEPIYAQPATSNASPWTVPGGWQSGANSSGNGATSPFTLAGFSDASIDEELG